VPRYDAVIVYVGTDASSADEDVDRTALTLPGAQASLINRVAARNPNTIVYMETVGPVDVRSFEPHISALLWSSYNGQRKGDGLADVLLGAYDPSARTSSLWVRDVGQLPAITDYGIRPTSRNPGRTHQYFTGEPKYAFGHGLSYTTFAYENLEVDRHTLAPDDTIHVSVEVRNTGRVVGDDVVQLYVTTPHASPALERPRKRLEGFENVALAPGETRTLTFTVPGRALAFFDRVRGRWTVDRGRYGVEISRSSADADVVLRDNVTIAGTLTPIVSVVDVRATMQGDAARGIVARVLFPEGVEIAPKLSVAMTDDRLYRRLPVGMTVRYASNRPSVVSVDSAGTIRTVRNGVATVTATVRYHGVARSGDFVVRVVSEAAGIAIDGRPLDEVDPTTPFRPDTFEYDVIVPRAMTDIPEVAAAAPDTDTTVIEQAARIPGIAKVTVTGPDGVARRYRIHFAHPARGDDFHSGWTGSQWTWIRPGVVLQPALGNWTVEAKIDFSSAPHAELERGGIMAYEDDRNYVRLAAIVTREGVRVTETIADSRSCCDPGAAQRSGPVSELLASIPTAPTVRSNTTVWLRMQKVGRRYRTYSSTDGTAFRPVYETGAGLDDAKIALFAVSRSGTTSDPTAAFDSFRVLGQSPPARIPRRRGAAFAAMMPLTPSN